MTTVDNARVSRIEWLLAEIALWAGNKTITDKVTEMFEALDDRNTPAPEREDRSDTATLPPALVERMVALVREIAGPPILQGNTVGKARAIVAELPEVVDGDLVEAVQVEEAIVGGSVFAETIEMQRAIALAGIKRGRQLQREGL